MKANSLEETIQVLPRHKISASDWDSCVANSRQRILYGYSWYLDAVLPAPFWKWIGIVRVDETGKYQAVMPVPLRRKGMAGVGKWVVHQPLFCQFLGIFGREAGLDSEPFFRLMQQKFRYGSVLRMCQPPDEPLSFFGTIRPASTHILDLSVGYTALYQKYTRDRKQNLKRAKANKWTVVESTDAEPLITLFRENHTDTIDGGVADWAYSLFRNLLTELSKRNLMTLRYACHDGRIEAGALFVQEGNRIIYLFNAASETGRRGNARTLLIDQMIHKYAGEPMIFDFESPEKPSIRQFYQSFGAHEDPFWEMRWNRLNPVENALKNLLAIKTI